MLETRAVTKQFRVFLIIILISTCRPEEMTAHPTGNFSAGHHSTIRVSPGGVEIRYLLDFAEIPTFQMISGWGMPPGKDVPAGLLRLYLDSQVRNWVQGLRAAFNGKSAPLTLVRYEAETAEGAGGIPTLRVLTELEAHGIRTEGVFEFEDTNFRDLIGWREVIVLGRPGIRFPDGNPYSEDRSLALRVYPEHLLSDPPSVDRIRVRVSRATGDDAEAGSVVNRMVAGWWQPVVFVAVFASLRAAMVFYTKGKLRCYANSFWRQLRQF